VYKRQYIGSSQPRAYGFVEMSLKSDGDRAIRDLNGKILNNLAMMVVESRALSIISVSHRYRKRN